MLNKSLL